MKMENEIIDPPVIDHLYQLQCFLLTIISHRDIRRGLRSYTETILGGFPHVHTSGTAAVMLRSHESKYFHGNV